MLVTAGRRFESKFDSKFLEAYLVNIRCEIPPAQKKVPLDYPAWIVIAKGGVGDNPFLDCQLMQDRSTRTHVHFPAETEYSCRPQGRTTCA